MGYIRTTIAPLLDPFRKVANIGIPVAIVSILLFLSCVCAVLILSDSAMADRQQHTSLIERMIINVGAVTIVQRKGQDNYCSGALISDRMVLTARHCVQDLGEPIPYPASSFQVGFGPSTFEPKTQWHDVHDVRLEGAYAERVESLRGNDLALIILETSVHRRPFPIARQGSLPQKDSQLMIIGFGEDRYGDVGRRHTIRVKITALTKNDFAFVGGGCRGDSGGPILDHKGQLVGLVSLGTSKHCIPNQIRFGQSLVPFSDFIAAQLRSSSSIQ